MSNPTFRMEAFKQLKRAISYFILVIISLILTLKYDFAFYIFSLYISTKILTIGLIIFLIYSIVKFIYNFMKLGAV